MGAYHISITFIYFCQRTVWVQCIYYYIIRDCDLSARKCMKSSHRSPHGCGVFLILTLDTSILSHILCHCKTSSATLPSSGIKTHTTHEHVSVLILPASYFFNRLTLSAAITAEKWCNPETNQKTFCWIYALPQRQHQTSSSFSCLTDRTVQ